MKNDSIIKKYKNNKGFNEVFLKYSKYQKTINSPIILKGIGIHNNNKVSISITPLYNKKGRYFNNDTRAFNIDNRNKKNQIMYKDLFRTINKDYNTPLYSFHELESFLLIGNRGFKKDLIHYKNEIYKKNFKIFQDISYSSEYVNNDTENYINAQIENVLRKPVHHISLENKKNQINGVEHLLSALESLSIDNVLISLNGGNEVPILDGSSLVWINELINAGTNTGQKDHYFNNNKKRRRKIKFYSNKSFSLYHNDSFISYHPSKFSKITVGLDYSDSAPLIGKQWFSYDIFNDNHYRWEISPSRMYIPTIQCLYESMDSGYFKAGIEDCVNLCMFDKWHNSDQIRFYDTESARHEILDLIGCLSLLSNNGNGGIPLGHIIAYKPSLELNIRFVKLLKELIII
mmetsp:Transcript_12834/g.25087  ORF Transcript_12834/g.25087 Transcript_12834/m.25087 type:complete len:403 (+) Transcript_12834:1-1209(+)